MDYREKVDVCRKLFLTAGTKAAVVAAVGTSVPFYFLYKRNYFPKYIKPNHLAAIVSASITGAFWVVSEKRSHQCLQETRINVVNARANM